MKNEFIPYEEALKLKELGFDEECLLCYFDGELALTTSEDTIPRNLEDNSWRTNRDFEDTFLPMMYNSVTAPLYQQVFTWFRQEHGLFSEINLTTKQENVAEFEFFILDFYEPIFESDDYKKYEEAKLDCLRKLIEHVKTK